MAWWNRLKQWLPAILWALMISGVSTDAFSSAHTSTVIIPVLHWLLPRADPETLERIHNFVRKSAHFTEYFIFSLLLFRGVRGKNRGWQLRWALWAFLIAAGYSAFAGGKAALRALAQSMARELGAEGIHVAHVVIDGAIDTEFIRSRFPERYAARKDNFGILNPESIAESYWMLHKQPRDAWTHEMDLRPWSETW